MFARRLLFGEILVCSALTVAIAARLTPVKTDLDAKHAASCMSNLKQLATGMAIYATDADDFLPPKKRWMDMVKPYLRTEALYHCPSVDAGGYGYAYSADVAGKNESKIAYPATTPLIFDSIVAGRSAVSTIKSLPRPGRHLNKNNVARTDTSVKAQ